MVSISYYETDQGYIFNDVSFRFSVKINENRETFPFDEIIPQIIRNQIREVNTKYFCTISKNILPREIYVFDFADNEYRFIIPFSSRSVSFWTQMINELNENVNIKSFEVYGERVKPYWLENIVFADLDQDG